VQQGCGSNIFRVAKIGGGEYFVTNGSTREYKHCGELRLSPSHNTSQTRQQESKNTSTRLSLDNFEYAHR